MIHYVGAHAKKFEQSREIEAQFASLIFVFSIFFVARHPIPSTFSFNLPSPSLPLHLHLKTPLSFFSIRQQKKTS